MLYYYTDEEKEAIRRQLRNGNELARKVIAKRRGLSIRPTPVAPAEKEMIDEKSIAETSPRKVEEGA